jgi:hypothetical protein
MPSGLMEQVPGEESILIGAITGVHGGQHQELGGNRGVPKVFILTIEAKGVPRPVGVAEQR